MKADVGIKTLRRAIEEIVKIREDSWTSKTSSYELSLPEAAQVWRDRNPAKALYARPAYLMLAGWWNDSLLWATEGEEGEE